MWVVLLGPAQRVYGPFDDEETAWRFARFVSEEVDPAFVLPLASPVSELLTWRETCTVRLIADLKAAAAADAPAATAETPTT
jgi:hypothetical protein